MSDSRAVVDLERLQQVFEALASCDLRTELLSVVREGISFPKKAKRKIRRAVSILLDEIDEDDASLLLRQVLRIISPYTPSDVIRKLNPAELAAFLDDIIRDGGEEVEEEAEEGSVPNMVTVLAVTVASKPLEEYTSADDSMTSGNILDSCWSLNPYAQTLRTFYDAARSGSQLTPEERARCLCIVGKTFEIRADDANRSLDQLKLVRNRWFTTENLELGDPLYLLQDHGERAALQQALKHIQKT